jgi:AcrR family transcriptional regulator
MLLGLAEAMMDKGYVDTTVADVIKRAGVSRETFYQQFSSKADCFLQAFDAAATLLLGTIERQVGLDLATLRPGDGRDAGARIDQFDRALGVYLDTLADNAPAARLFLVEVYAAGPDAVRRRADVQQRIVDGVAVILGIGLDDEAGRFACDVLVNAIDSMVTGPLVAGEPERLPPLREPIVALVRRAAALVS